MSDRARLILGAGLSVVALVALILTLQGLSRPDQVAVTSGMTASEDGRALTPGVTPTPSPTPEPDPLVPTLPLAVPVTPALEATSAPGDLLEDAPLRPPDLDASKPPTQVLELPLPLPSSPRSRLGLGVPPSAPGFDEAMARQLGIGWYLNWRTEPQPLPVPGLDFAQMVRTTDRGYEPRRSTLASVLAANPGALWLIGNEPDVPWQDNTTPEDYALVYHELYTFIKALDPSAQVAIGGVSQPTPLRLLYLDRVLAAYQELYGSPMPVDVWNVHAFILREERDSWGVSIPPGFDVPQGLLYEIEDHDDLEIFRQQIVDFRRWMAQHGQQDKPLIVSEYGVLMPEGYGFPPQAVAAFMKETFNFFLTARDPEIGYPADDHRLVQRFAWFSYGDNIYPTGNLVDYDTGELTYLGQAFADYASRLGETPEG